MLKRRRELLLRSVCLLVAFGATFTPCIRVAWAGDVTADGRSATTVTTTGAVTNVTTATVSQSYGINSFSSFQVSRGESVNLVVPNAAVGTINLVTGSRSVIDGAVRSVQNGAVGGSLHFANSNGIVVGANGSIEGGSVSLSTPTSGFLSGFFGADGRPNAAAVTAIVDGTAPQSAAGIAVEGAVRGVGGVSLRTGGDIAVTGEVTAGSRDALIAAAVNTGGVKIRSAGKTTIGSKARIRSEAGEAGGRIDIRADGAIEVEGGARILAEGIGAGKGGTIDIFAGTAARLGRDAVISASASGTGDGGAIEFSAEESVVVAGTLAAASASGRHGRVLLDPTAIDGSVDVYTDVAQVGTYEVIASGTITLHGIHVTADEVSLAGGGIVLETGTVIESTGDVTLSARSVDTDLGPTNALPIGAASITLDGATISGRDVKLIATVYKDQIIAADAAVTSLAATLEAGAEDAAGVPGLASKIDEQVGAQVTAIATKAQAFVTENDIEQLPTYLSAKATIDVSNSTITAARDVVMQSRATTAIEIAPEAGSIAVAVAGSNTVARTIVADSHVVAGRDVTVTADTQVTQTLTAVSNVPGASAVGLATDAVNGALAASFRRSVTEVVVTRDPTSADPSDPVLFAGRAVEIAATAKETISVTAEAVTNAAGRGVAVALSVDDVTTTAALGAAVRTDAGKFALRAETIVEDFSDRATVTGGSLAENVATSGAALGASAFAPYAGTLRTTSGTVADALSDDGTGTSATASDQHGVALALSNHAITTEALLGAAERQVVDPSTDATTSLGLASVYVTATSGAHAGRSPTIDLLDPATGVHVTAATTVLAASQAAAVSVDAGSGGTTSVTAANLAHWNFDTSATSGTPSELPGARVEVLAEVPMVVSATNTLPSLADRGALDTAWDAYATTLTSEAASTSAVAGWSRGEAPVVVDGSGEETHLFSAVARSTGAGVGVGVDATIVSGSIAATATLGEGFRWRPNTIYDLSQDASAQGYGTTALSVTVTAANHGDLTVKTGATGVGVDGAVAGYGGALSIVDVLSSTMADVGDHGVIEGANAVVVTADQDMLVANQARAYGSTGGEGSVGGAIAVTILATSTSASLDAGATVGIFGDLAITARDTTDVLTLAGSDHVSSSSAIDFGVAITATTRETLAGIVAPEGGVAGAPSLVSALTIEAETSGSVTTIGGASAQSGNGATTASASDPTNSLLLGANQIGDLAGELGTSITGAGGASSIAISGDFAGTYATVSTQVELSGATVVQSFSSDASLFAHTAVAYGEASALTSASTGTTAISGATGLNAIHHETSVVMSGGRLVAWAIAGAPTPVGGSDDYIATDRSSLDLVIAGTAGASDTGFDVSASATYTSFSAAAAVTLTDGAEASTYGDLSFSGGRTLIDVADFSVGRTVEITAAATPVATLTAAASRDLAGLDNGGSSSTLGSLFGAAGDATSETGGGLDGLSITVNPLKVAASATIVVKDSAVEADQHATAGQSPFASEESAGRVSLWATAQTTVTIDTSGDTLAASVAITDTDALVALRNATVSAAGNGSVTITSLANEVQDLSALSGTQSGLKSVGVLSVRSLSNQILIDAEAGETDGHTRISAPAVHLDALTTHDLSFTARATDATDHVKAAAAVVSLAKSLTQVAAGGTFDTGWSSTTSSLDIVARDTWTDWTVEATVSNGAFAEPGTGDENATGLLAHFNRGDLADGIFALGERAAAENATEATDGTSTPWGQRTSFGLALALERHDVTTRATLGGTAVTPEGASVALLGGTATAVTISAETKIDDISKHVSAKIANGAAASVAGVGVLSFGVWNLDTEASVGAHGSVSNGVTVTATTTLPTVGFDTRENMALDDLANGIGADFAEGAEVAKLGIADMAPKVNTLLHEGDWQITNETIANGKGADWAIDAGVHTFTATTRATIDDGAALSGGDVTVTATATGGITSARIAGDAGSTAEKLGVGGALQVLRGTFTTEASVGDLAGHAASVGDITVKAENKLTFAADALSYGAAAKLAFNGAFTVLDYAGAARGIVDAATTYTAGDLLVTAHDGSILIAGAAAANQGTSAGVGIASTLIFADREATAALAEREAGEIVALVALPTTSRLSDLASTFASITLTATDDGLAVATAEAGAKRAEDDLMVVDGENGFPDMILQRRKEDEETATALGEQTPDPAAAGDVTGKKFGFKISADYVGVFTDHATTALLSASRPIEAGPISVSATDTSIAALATGATVAGAGSVGLGGSFSQFVGDRATRAAVEAASVDFRPRYNAALGLWAPASLLVTAKDTASTRVLSAGRAGETLKSSVLGSAASAAGDVSVTAEIASAEVLEGTGLTVSARRSGDTLVAAGALSLDDAVASSGESPIVPSDEAAAKGVAIGVAFAATDLGETVVAQVVSTTLDTVPSPAITAKNDAMLAAVAKSSGGSNTLNLAGSAIYLEVDRTTTARLDGGADHHAVSLEGGLELRATDETVTRARIGLEGAADGFGVGATAIVVADTKTVAVELSDTSVDIAPTGTLVEDYYSLVVAAETFATIDAEQSGGMASDTGIVGEAAVGIVTTNWTTSATVAETDVTTDGSVAIGAWSAASIRNAQGAMTDASKGAGTLGFASTQVQSNIAVTISDSSILGRSWFTPEIRDIASLVYVTASSDEYIETEAVRNGSADAALGAVFAWTKTTGAISTTVSNSEFDSQVLAIEAADQTVRSNTASAAATASALGAAGAIVVDDYRRSTAASVTGGTIGTHLERLGVDASGNLIFGNQYGGASVTANSATIASNVAIGRDTGDGEVGFAGVLTWARDDRDVTATVTDAHVAFQDATWVSSGSWVQQSAFSVSADRSDTHFLLQATESSSASAVGIGAGILRVGGDTRATVDRPTLTTSGAWALGTGSFSVTASDSSLALVVGLGGASTGAFGAVGSLAVIDMGRTPESAVTIAPDGRGDAARGTQASAEASLGAEVLARTQDTTVTSTTRDTTIAATVSHAASTDLLYTHVVRVSDTRQAYAIAGQLSAEIVSPALDTVETIVSVDHFGADGIDLTLKGAGIRDSLAGGEGGDITPVPTNRDGPASYRIGEDVGMANLALYDASVRPDLAPAAGAGGLSIGFSLAAATIGGAVEAKVDVASGATVNFATGGTHAWSGTTTVASAVGAQLDGGVQLGASASLARQATATETAITGAGTMKALAGGWQETSAMRAAISWSVSGLLQLSGGRLAGGATFAANDFDSSVTARVEDATLAVGWNTREIIAHDASNQITVALAGGGSDIGVGLSVAVSSNDDAVKTVIDGATVTGTGEFFVLTGRDADQTSLVLQAMSGSQLGFGAALAVDNIRGSVTAEITGSTISDPRNVQVLTENISIIKAATVGLAIGGSVSVSGSMSVLENTTAVGTTIDDSTLTATTGSVTVHSHDETEVAGIGGGGEGFFDELGGLTANVSASGAVGVGVGLTIVKARPTVTTLVTGDSYLYGRGSIYAASIGMGWKLGVAILADADLDVDTLSITGSFAGEVAVAAQVPIVIVGSQVATTVAADASGAPEIASGSTLQVLAQNTADVSVLSFVGTGGGAGAVGADVEAISDHRSTATLVDGATLTGSTVSAKAISTETISTTSASLAGGAFAGVAGIVQVIDSESATTARVIGSTITSTGSFTLSAEATRTITRTAVGIGGGFAGVGGVVYVLSTDDTVLAEVASAASETSDDRTTLDVNGNFTLQALSTTTLGTTAIAGGIGLGAVEGAISVTHVTDTVTARFGDWATLVPDKANAVTITASDTFTATETVGGGSIGFVGIGASVAVTSLASLVSAEVGEHASLDTTGALTVQAIGTRTIDSSVVSGGVGLGALQAAVSVVTFGESADEENSRGTLDDLKVRLAADPYASDGEGFSGGDAQVGGLLTEARAGRSTHTIDDIYASTATDTVRVVIGDHASLDATGNITVTATEKTTARVTSGAGAIGALGFSAGVGVVRMGSDVDVTLDDHVTLTSGGDVTVKAEAAEASTSDPSKVTALAGGLALISGTGAVAEMKVERDIDVTIGDGSRLDAGLDVVVKAVETTSATASATSVSLGLTAIGGVSATAREATSLDVTIGDGAATTFAVGSGHDVEISIARTGTISADTLGVAGGVIVVNGSFANAIDESHATIDLGATKVDRADAVVVVTILNGGDVTADADGGSVAFGAVGYTQAIAERHATTTLRASALDVVAANLTLLAIDAAGETGGTATTVTATSSSAMLGTAGFGGAMSKVDSDSDVVVDVAFSRLVADDARVAAVTNTQTVASSKGLIFAAIAVGANTTSIESDTTATTKIAFDGAAIVAHGFTGEAIGVDDATGSVVSGSGAIIQVEAAKATVDITSDTVLEVTGAGGLTARDIVLRTSRDMTAETTGDSRSASLAGYGATALETIITSDSAVTIDTDLHAVGDGTHASSVTIAAETTLTKTSVGYDGQIGSGGAVQGQALASKTTVIDLATIDVKSGTTITQTDAAATPGAVSVQIVNLYDIADAVKIDTGGGILFPHAESNITVDTGSQRITFDGATIDARGRVTASIVTDATLANEVYVNVYGLAGAPSGSSSIEYDGSQTIEVKGTSILSREGDVVLSAGTAAGEGQSVVTSVETRLWNRTATPLLDDPDATADVSQTNAVTIDAASSVRAAEDVVITAKAGTVDPYAYGEGHDYWREGSEEVVNFFGGIVGADEVSYDVISSTKKTSAHDGVVVNGTVEAGAFAHNSLTIDAAGNATLVGEAIKPVYASGVRLAATYETYRLGILLRLAGTTSDEMRALLTAELARIDSIISMLGSQTVDTVTIDGVTARVGDVMVTADYLEGAGTITAHGDATVSIVNESPKVVIVGDVTIPFRDGGEVRFNGVPVTSATTIASMNGAQTGAKASYANEDHTDPHLTVQAYDSDTVEPTVHVENRWANVSGGISGDILVTGTIENLKGTVSLATSDGNIMILGGSIEAQTVDISSAGDFLITETAPDAIVNAGGDPIGVYADFFDDYEAWVKGGQIGAAPTFALATAATTGITARGGVYIYARTINVDGLIQSGVTDWDLTVTAGFDALLSAQTFSSNDVQVVYSPDGGGSTLGERYNLVAGGAYVTGNMTLRYDPVGKTLLVDPIVTKGGHVELVGSIVSTGNGRIVAADGYGRVDVDSQSALPLIFDAVSTGVAGGVAGSIRIVDLDRPGMLPGTFVTTTYTKNEDGTSKVVTNYGGAITSTDVANATYAIHNSHAYEMQIGEVQSGTATKTVTEYVAVNGTVLETTESWSSTVDALASQPYTSATLTTPTGAVAAYTYGGTSYVLGPLTEVGQAHVVSEDPATWGNQTAVLRKTVTDYTYSGAIAYDTHTIAANLPIAIAFEGYASSRVNVSAKGDVIFSGTFLNQGGPTTVTSTAGSILTSSSSVVLETAKTTLTAAGDVGQRSGVAMVCTLCVPKGGSPTIPGAAPLEAMRIDQQSGTGLTVSAGGDVMISEVAGDMLVSSIVSTSLGAVTLSAAGSIRAADAAPLDQKNVSGGALSLTALSGTIGAIDRPLFIDARDGLTASAAESISLHQNGHDLGLVSVVSQSGSVTIDVSGGSIVDVNTSETEDRRATSGLLEALWDELGLRGNAYASGSANTRDLDAVAALVATQNAAYREYWMMRGLDPVTSGGTTTLVGRAYDANTRVTLTTSDRARLVSLGKTEAEITAIETALDARYRALHAQFGATTWDAAWTWTPPAAAATQVTEGVFWTTNQLRRGIRRGLVLDTTDTQLTIEAPNVVGTNVTLTTDEGIGHSEEPLSFTELVSDAARNALWTAERSDIVVRRGQGFTVTPHEDVDVEASGTVTARAVDWVHLGSEGSLTLAEASAVGDVRVKVGGSLLLSPDAIGPVVTGKDIVLEAATGSIGTLSDPMSLHQLADGSVSARAATGVHLEASGSSLRVGAIYSPADVTIVAGGSITDADASTPIDISAGSIALVAGTWIGTGTDALGLEQLDAAGRVDALALTGDVHLAVPRGDLTAGSIGALLGATTLEVAEDLRLANAVGAASVHARDAITLTVGGTVSGHGAAGIVDLRGGSLVLDAGAVASDGLHVAADTLAMETASGALHVVAEGDVTARRAVAIGGDVDLFATGALTLDGTVMAGTAGTPHDVVLTAVSDDLSGTLTRIAGSRVQLTALAGSVGTPDASLAVERAEVDLWSVMADRHIVIDITGAGIIAEKLVAATGGIAVAADGAIVAGLVGSHDPAILVTDAAVHIAANGAAEPVASLPEVDGVVRAASYTAMTAEAGGVVHRQAPETPQAVIDPGVAVAGAAPSSLDSIFHSVSNPSSPFIDLAALAEVVVVDEVAAEILEETARKRKKTTQ